MNNSQLHHALRLVTIGPRRHVCPNCGVKHYQGHGGSAVSALHFSCGCPQCGAVDVIRKFLAAHL